VCTALCAHNADVPASSQSCSHHADLKQNLLERFELRILPWREMS
jgi:hypothetical protein